MLIAIISVLIAFVNAAVATQIILEGPYDTVIRNAHIIDCSGSP
jgi:hypothetical protein